MYHNIPKQLALEHLTEKLKNSSINTCSIPIEDIVSLVTLCLNCNHFKFKEQIYHQREGLPMGNRLSGLIAELFINKVEKETYAKLNINPIAFRYVDDLLIFTKGEDEARLIFNTFNNNPYGLKFTIELPVNNEIPYLDFKIKIIDEGMVEFDFYRKPTRKDNFVNANTALPSKCIDNIITSEWQRIKNRCSDNDRLKHHNDEFSRRLERNGFELNDIAKSTRTNNNNQPNNNTKFFLSIPFINNEVEYKIKNALKGLKVNICIAHKGNKLKDAITNQEDKICHLKGCTLQNQICFEKGTVYEIKCSRCGKSYIGSSYRHLHVRYKEHLTQRTSPIYLHNIKCQGDLVVRVLTKDRNIQKMRIKEAILIKKMKPSMNVKDDLFKSHILFY
jgi:hypothetical protein